MTNITVEKWSKIMLRKNFNPWIHYSTLVIYEKYNIIDLFYDCDSHLPAYHYYCFPYSHNENVDDDLFVKYTNLHIKYTKFPLILCLIYLSMNSNIYKNLQSKKYFEKIIPEDCSKFSKSDLCDKIKFYNPDPFCLIPSNTSRYKKYAYSYKYIQAVKKIYNI